MAMLVKLKLRLEPVNCPGVRIAVGNIVQEQRLIRPMDFNFSFDSKKYSESLSIAHFGKDANDAESAVIIKQISFFGIADPRFIWLGQYTPVYPEPWLSQQTPEPPATLNSTDYLGWNGVWQLDFSVPVFTWIHQIQSLGWIHP
jgi:hypothetical protein